MKRQNELIELYKVYEDKQVKYPHKMRINNPFKGALYTEFTVDNRSEVWSRIKDLEYAKQQKYKCTFCDKYYKEDVSGRFMPMDKRESGDGLFGDVFACFKCVPKEYGRL